MGKSLVSQSLKVPSWCPESGSKVKMDDQPLQDSWMNSVTVAYGGCVAKKEKLFRLDLKPKKDVRTSILGSTSDPTSEAIKGQ